MSREAEALKRRREEALDFIADSLTELATGEVILPRHLLHGRQPVPAQLEAPPLDPHAADAYLNHALARPLANVATTATRRRAAKIEAALRPTRLSLVVQRRIDAAAALPADSPAPRWPPPRSRRPHRIPPSRSGPRSPASPSAGAPSPRGHSTPPRLHASPPRARIFVTALETPAGIALSDKLEVLKKVRHSARSEARPEKQRRKPRILRFSSPSPPLRNATASGAARALSRVTGRSRDAVLLRSHTPSVSSPRSTGLAPGASRRDVRIAELAAAYPSLNVAELANRGAYHAIAAVVAYVEAEAPVPLPLAAAAHDALELLHAEESSRIGIENALATSSALRRAHHSLTRRAVSALDTVDHRATGTEIPYRAMAYSPFMRAGK
ncbi:uncharacterized protein AMSG_10413 [Thecamonas trahens ATCC 50062]|uniref:Uncharacterized protein n=1 Tax=Thecamonas trahens ATCC 50062 TaxID=461836 RepID=A0A0L0DQK4_THETB|nr:hypothetical protein AMSG_10413 [Thecamonas trahens ATCC 50062]KNC54562.1 hypothetical protein AMSG_10413 [Thecamonas trahens ATCC 50062]|eukprot:XP_013753577.1 hypothetical protein AMSG_10413 [Thecamonas trahens ATCC 50062]